jgi:D-amino-acid dehydrogenase
VIGRSPRHQNVLLAFGHGHIGLTLSARTGQIIADLIDGNSPGVDLSPYRPNRF